MFADSVEFTRYLLVHLQELLEVVEGDLTKLRPVDVPANAAICNMSDSNAGRVAENRR